MSASEAGAVNPAAEMTGAAVRSRTLDDRLTLVAIRMTYVSLTFFFASFYFGQVYLQLINEHGMWKPKGVDHPAIALGALELGLVLASGLVYFWGQWAGLYTRNFTRLHLGLWVAALLGALAVIPHVIELHHPGFSLQAGGYASVFIAIEGVYTPLLVVAVIALLGVANRSRLGLFRESGIAIEVFGEFWGWMCAIALLNFLALYVQPFFPIA
ncbi:MAG: hypothetical protein ACR2JC_07295 [Chloroflexota bacterium]|nr:MAG: hypothetical protein DLM70_14810 [Chloroflexota bacterium]